jgi:eukaryotic-like serine/threonine-protein kinase
MNQFGSIQVREGDLLAGKYRIERVIGVGGMGIVVAARHEQLDQLVAIKFVRDDALDNDEAVERFLREARSAARLKSEHVARVLDVGRLESGAPYMVMEFLEGNDLGQALTRDGPMAVDLAAALMLQVCEAVAEAHAAGIVHRDLKPENLFLTRTVGGSPKMKVLDFGVSRSTRLSDDPKAKLTRTSTMLGSPLYMAPEQMRSSRDVDARGDVWALGVVLFELLTARSPFEAGTMPELCLKIVQEPPLSLAELRPVLPPSLVAVVERCLEKDRNKRYADAAELATALEAFAPPRSNLFSGRMQGDFLGRPSAEFPGPMRADSSAPLQTESLREAGTLAAPGPGSGGPARVASIPAAWGTEGRRESQQAPPKRSRAAIWIGVVLVAAAAAVTLLAWRGSAVLEHPGVAAGPTEPPPPAASALAPPAVVLSELPPAALPPAAEAPAALPPAAEAPAASAAAAGSSDPASPASTARSAGPSDPAGTAAKKPVVSPSVYRVARPQSPGPTSAHSATGVDEDIPSLR